MQAFSLVIRIAGTKTVSSAGSLPAKWASMMSEQVAEIVGQSWRTVAIQLPPLATSAMREVLAVDAGHEDLGPVGGSWVAW